MSDSMIGLIGIGALMLLIFLRMPIAFAMALVGFIGFGFVSGFEGALSVVRLVPPRLISDYTLAVLPLFLFMGIVVSNTGISRDLYSTMYAWVGQYRGGLAMATVLACGGFAAVSGSSMAGAATMGKLVAPEMRRYKYDPRLAAGSVAAGGTLGSLIPPSLAFIMYAMLTEMSVGRLFMAGIFPGILEVVFYIIVIIVVCWIRPAIGPAGPKTSFITKLFSLKTSWSTLLLFVIVMGGIYMGIFTTTEAAGIGAFGALAIALCMRRLSRANFKDSLEESGRLTAMMLILLMGATIFSRFMAVSQLPFLLADMIANLPLSPMLILIAILLTYIILGMFFDVFAAMMLTIPIIFPVIVSLGLDPIWYGVLMVRMTEIGLITPPIGMNIFILVPVMNVSVEDIFKGALWFVIADILQVAVLLAFPQISLFLPNLMMSK
jgi:tripartite ATP-independent transporter DctM subunit